MDPFGGLGGCHGLHYGRIVSFLRKSFHSILRRLRTSKKKSEVLTTNENGLSEASTASEVKSDLRFAIVDPNCICNHVCYGCLGLCLFVEEKIKKANWPLLDLSALPQLKIRDKARQMSKKVKRWAKEKFTPSLIKHIKCIKGFRLFREKSDAVWGSGICILK